ncbi:hypothetical protein OH77DRAFT_762141 [Trametes cingulata]|nr:hypothetical protein OH77DRAFT_762141 [Trametes cingulata]
MQQYGYCPPSQNSSRKTPQRPHSSSPTWQTEFVCEQLLGTCQSAVASTPGGVIVVFCACALAALIRVVAAAYWGQASPHVERGQQTVPVRGRAQSLGRRSIRLASERPALVHSSSLPPPPLPAFDQTRQSCAMPKASTGFENISRPLQGGRWQTALRGRLPHLLRIVFIHSFVKPIIHVSGRQRIEMHLPNRQTSQCRSTLRRSVCADCTYERR